MDTVACAYRRSLPEKFTPSSQSQYWISAISPKRNKQLPPLPPLLDGSAMACPLTWYATTPPCTAERTRARRTMRTISRAPPHARKSFVTRWGARCTTSTKFERVIWRAWWWWGGMRWGADSLARFVCLWPTGGRRTCRGGADFGRSTQRLCKLLVTVSMLYSCVHSANLFSQFSLWRPLVGRRTCKFGPASFVEAKRRLSERDQHTSDDAMVMRVAFVIVW